MKEAASGGGCDAVVVRGETRAWPKRVSERESKVEGGDGVHVCQFPNAAAIGEAACGEGGVRTEDDAPG